MLGPVIESLAKKHQGDIVFAKIDVDKNRETLGMASAPSPTCWCSRMA